MYCTVYIATYKLSVHNYMVCIDLYAYAVCACVFTYVIVNIYYIYMWN